MLLEKLVEKKDIMAYTEFRIKTLVRNIKEVPDKEPEHRREEIIEKLSARVDELKRIRSAVADGRLKEESKNHYVMARPWEDEPREEE